VVVDFDAGEILVDCLRSLRAEGLRRVVVVENGDPVAARTMLRQAGLGDVPLVVPGTNIGYGAGANRGIAATTATTADGHAVPPGKGTTGAGTSTSGGANGTSTPTPEPASPYVLICNPDLLVHPGALSQLVEGLDAEPAWAIIGPRILDPRGLPYPSARSYPSMTDAVGHALLGVVRPENRFTRRYRSPDGAGEAMAAAGWVSGACFLARRSAMEELGGFDESYFMFAEDMDLCWRAHQAGWGVGVQPAAVVTHAEGVTRKRHPYRMLVAHHRSALRFANRTTGGWRRAALPLAAIVLGARLAVACVSRAIGSESGP